MLRQFDDEAARLDDERWRGVGRGLRFTSWLALTHTHTRMVIVFDFPFFFPSLFRRNLCSAKVASRLEQIRLVEDQLLQSLLWQVVEFHLDAERLLGHRLIGRIVVLLEVRMGEGVFHGHSAKQTTEKK